MELTKEMLLNYLIDVTGYRYEEIKDHSKGDLLALLSDTQLNDCLEYNK